ncbi:MAG TPA: hypothetical protein VFE94_01120 [Candidatus Paceibacterota bacterium]|nr:hypothetical protein [Candidatus Paceibacterota bacterium]
MKAFIVRPWVPIEETPAQTKGDRKHLKRKIGAQAPPPVADPVEAEKTSSDSYAKIRADYYAGRLKHLNQETLQQVVDAFL